LLGVVFNFVDDGLFKHPRVGRAIGYFWEGLTSRDIFIISNRDRSGQLPVFVSKE
jgi:hypothetical protein